MSAFSSSPTPFMALTGKFILVTGASSGIGQSIAVTAAGLGARLALHGRDRDRLAATQAMLPGSGHVVFAKDLSNCEGFEGWVEEVVNAVGPLSGFVHSAGIIATEPLKLMTAEHVESMWRVNVLSGLLIAKEMRKAKNHSANASIVYVSSVAGMRGSPGQIAYSASKGALISATRSMALELVRDRIRVNAVAPALVESAMSAAILRTAGEAAYKETLRNHPMGIGSTDDVAQLTCFLLSDAAKWITGAVYPVDGGYTA